MRSEIRTAKYSCGWAINSLVLADAGDAKYFQDNNLASVLIEQSIEKEQLALDRRRDSLNLEKYQLVYEQDFVRLLKVNPEDM